uniref:Serine protease snake n=2 Tax=Lygus hesperus TaxID=30085 RepID=A0A146LZH1_LYGHE
MRCSQGNWFLLGLTLVSLVMFTPSAFAGKLLNLKEGQSCGPDKTCKKISECDSVNRDIGYRQKVETCGYNKDHLPIVCCTEVTDRTPVMAPVNKTISEKMCEKYAEYVFAPAGYSAWAMTGKKQRRGRDMCGTVAEPLINGGKHAKLREYPHMVQIGYGSPARIPTNPDAWLCGGSLISELFVLSAAHCTYLKVKKKPVGVRTKTEFGGLARWARMGVHDTRILDNGFPQILKIVDWINRTDYTGTGYNDIVLFKLEKNVKLNPNVRPICLQVNEYIDETRAIATGWGKLNHGSAKLNTHLLRKVGLNIVENEECEEAYNKGLFSEGIKDTQLCAGDSVGHDTCPGDSGGPLQVHLKDPYCMYSLIGIISGGSGKCGSGLPGIYTRVSKYVSWIEENVWPNEK